MNSDPGKLETAGEGIAVWPRRGVVVGVVPATIFEACGARIGQPDDVVPGLCFEACAEEENADAMRNSQLVVQMCSRDPYLAEFVPNELEGDVNVRLFGAPCIDGGRADSSLGPLTEKALTDACADAP